MKKVWLLVLATLVFALAGCGGGGGGGDDRGSVRIVNNSSGRIMYLYISPTSQGTWGPDQLGQSTIPAGGSFTINSIPPGAYDVRAVMQSGNSYTVYNITVNAGQTTTINNPAGNTKATSDVQEIIDGSKDLAGNPDGAASFAVSDVQGPAK